jgi:hypothetical protein
MRVCATNVMHHILTSLPLLSSHRYASLFFVFCVDTADNELIVLEVCVVCCVLCVVYVFTFAEGRVWCRPGQAIHLLVRAMDKYFGNVCELDLIFNFDKVYKTSSLLPS